MPGGRLIIPEVLQSSAERGKKKENPSSVSKV